MDAPFVYLNGQVLPRSRATLDIEDRGTLFADGVYEVVSYYDGRPLALREHIDRFRRSLDAIHIPVPAELDQLGGITDDLLKRNGYNSAKAYWQITRGVAPREHSFPRNTTPTVLVITYPAAPPDPAAPPRAIACVTHEDQRWSLCSIKSLMLLPNVLAKNAALEKGAQEAIFLRDGRVTEGTSTSVFAVRGGELWTHPADHWILGGITRAILIEEAKLAGVTVNESAVPWVELSKLNELFICGTTTHVAGVVTLDGRPIGDGRVGPVTRRMHELLMRRITKL
ncbi:MAG: aminotransferase class IV [Planctomycetes bacterium]|nr:aminotransferase class IV [Planctomycetota bacterium]